MANSAFGLLIIDLYGCLTVTHYRELEEICDVSSKAERASRLMTLMNDHWFLDDYMETMAETFGPEMILITMDIYVQLLLFVYVVIWEIVVLGLLSSSPYVYASGFIELSIIIGKFIYLCHRCDSTVEEVIFVTLWGRIFGRS